MLTTVRLSVAILTCVVVAASASDDPFSEDYFIARSRFRAAVERAGGRLTALELDAVGPAGEDLTIDIAWFGSEEPRRVLVHCSGTHGSEAFAGSAIQLQLLEDGIPPLPEDGAICLVHVLNPYGMAWLRRVNENNVDLNRNFLAPDKTYTGAHPLYRQMDSLLNPKSPPSRDMFFARVGWFVLRHGMAKMKQAVAGGQYEYPGGLFFGGAELEDGPRQYTAYMAERLTGVERVVGIDVHTGLGSFGEDMLLVAKELLDTPAYDTMRDVYGDRVTLLAPTVKDVYTIRGAHKSWYPRAFPTATQYLMTQEVGTYSGIKVLHALREENRGHHYGGKSLDHSTKRKLKQAFTPEKDRWRQAVLRLGRQRIEQARQLAFGSSE